LVRKQSSLLTTRKNTGFKTSVFSCTFVRDERLELPTFSV
jgi:hypothetical protein